MSRYFADPTAPDYALYRASYGRPPRRRSFLGEHLARIVVGIVVIAGAAALVNGWAPARREVCARVEIPICPPDLQEEALGRWEFARYDPEGPHAQANGMTAVPISLTFFEDGDFVDLVEVRFDGGGSGQQRNSGWYEVKSQGDGWARVEITNSDEHGFVLLEFGRRELRVTDEATDATSVYRRA